MPQKDQGWDSFYHVLTYVILKKDLLFRCFPIIDRAQCATPATPTQRAGVAYATPAPPLPAPLLVALLLPFRAVADCVKPLFRYLLLCQTFAQHVRQGLHLSLF